MKLPYSEHLEPLQAYRAIGSFLRGRVRGRSVESWRIFLGMTVRGIPENEYDINVCGGRQVSPALVGVPS